MPGWGSAIGKIFDWVPGRSENRRNKINKIKREMDELTKKDNSPSNNAKYAKLSRKLCKAEEKAINAG